jgi:Family of unknown function (DUF6491)
MRLLPGLVPLILLSVAGCATTQSTAEKPAGETTPLMSRDDANLQTYRIDDWSAPDNRTLIVKSVDGSQYRAQFMSECLGLRFTNSIGFETRGLNQLDQFSGIVLPDGTRCHFQSFTRIGFPDKSAEVESGTQKQ